MRMAKLVWPIVGVAAVCVGVYLTGNGRSADTGGLVPPAQADGPKQGAPRSLTPKAVWPDDRRLNPGDEGVWTRAIWLLLPQSEALEYGWTIERRPPPAGHAAWVGDTFVYTSALVWHRKEGDRQYLLDHGRDFATRIEIRGLERGDDHHSDWGRLWFVRHIPAAPGGGRDVHWELLGSLDRDTAVFRDAGGTEIDGSLPILEQRRRYWGRPIGGGPRIPEWANPDGGELLLRMPE